VNSKGFSNRYYNNAFKEKLYDWNIDFDYSNECDNIKSDDEEYKAILEMSDDSENMRTHKLLFETPYGNFKVHLYDFTPNHQKEMLFAVRSNVYNNVNFFNRVVKNILVQGGESDESVENREKDLDPNERIRLPPEFNDHAFHKIGALCAGRDVNPIKGSFLNQIYFIVGRKVERDITYEEMSKKLDKFEMDKNKKFTVEQRDKYLTEGGCPGLDGDYTVFGEVYEGIDVLLKISQVETYDYKFHDDTIQVPKESIAFKITEID